MTSPKPWPYSPRITRMCSSTGWKCGGTVKPSGRRKRTTNGPGFAGSPRTGAMRALAGSDAGPGPQRKLSCAATVEAAQERTATRPRATRIGPYALLRLRLCFPRIVRGVHVGDLERPVAGDRDARAPLRARPVVHVRLQGSGLTGTQGLLCLRVDLVAHAEPEVSSLHRHRLVGGV